MTEPTRDTDLDALMNELRVDTPYIEKPDELDVDVGGGCFLNANRVCGPDCTAYLGAELPTAVERCAVLSSAVRGVGLIEQIIELSRLLRPRQAPPDIAPPYAPAPAATPVPPYVAPPPGTAAPQPSSYRPEWRWR